MQKLTEIRRFRCTKEMAKALDRLPSSFIREAINDKLKGLDINDLPIIGNEEWRKLSMDLKEALKTINNNKYANQII